MKLKIGIMGTRGIPNQYGGFEQFAQYLSLGLHARGHEVHVYNSDRHPFQQDQWNGVHIIHCKDLEYKLGTFGQFFYDFNCISDARKRNFDILLHLGYTSDSAWHWRWPKRSINIVNMDGMEWKRSKYNRLTQKFLKWAESLAVKNAQILVADSRKMQQYLFDSYHKKIVYIPYGAEVFTNPDPSVPAKYRVSPAEYFILVARMEPENNIAMIIQGYLDSKQPYPLLVVGNTSNNYGKYLHSQFNHPSVIFTGSVFDQPELNSLRYFAAKYFHGHSVGGTNPSLLEAMACGCTIAAHNNVFNRTILLSDADYFSSDHQVSMILQHTLPADIILQRKQANFDKIRTLYNLKKNVLDYEHLMLSSCYKETYIMQPSAVENMQFQE